MKDVMLNVQVAQSLSNLITFIIAYISSITLAGYCASWVALKMGDDTPADQGFLTLNPIMHVDIVGLLFIVVYHFGWGRFIPLDPFNITAPFRILKLIVMYCAESVAHWMIALVSVCALFGLFGAHATMILYRPIHQVFPESSSYLLSIGLILHAFLLANIMLFVLTLLAIALPVALYIFFGDIIMRYALMITWIIGYSITTLFI
jgi:hypothetical protein